MKAIRTFSIAVLALLVGMTTLALAQREGGGREGGRPPEGQQMRGGQPPQRAPQAQAPQRAPQAQAPQRAPRPVQASPGGRSGGYGGVYSGGVRPNDPTHGGVHHSGVPQNRNQVRAGFVQSRAQSWERDHRSWAQRGGYAGYRIPPDRFRQYFGHDHFFRIYNLPMNFVGGYPRFLYDGYWVTFVDPWPDAWPANWYETDDVYVDYVDDGYYLFDRMRPGPGIAITFSF